MGAITTVLHLYFWSVHMYVTVMIDLLMDLAVLTVILKTYVGPVGLTSIETANSPRHRLSEDHSVLFGGPSILMRVVIHADLKTHTQCAVGIPQDKQTNIFSVFKIISHNFIN